MGVPDKLALDLDDQDVIVVELRDSARRPVLAEVRQLLSQVYCVVHTPPPLVKGQTMSGEHTHLARSLPHCRRSFSVQRFSHLCIELVELGPHAISGYVNENHL